MIEARGVARRFGDKRALNPVDFELPQRGFLVVVGPNGSGKTTLLRLCAGLLVPTAGDLAHSARDILTVYKEQHGTEQNYGFLKDPVIVNSLFLKKPERIEALGLVLLLALLIWRVMERAMRRHVDPTRTPLPGWDKKATERPTAFMMVTKFTGVIVLKLGHDRQLARPLSVVQQQYLTALDVPATCFTLPAG